MFTTFSYWVSFANCFLAAYPWAIIICALLYIFFRRKTGNEIINWVYVFNTITCWLALINLILYLQELFAAWYGQNSYERYAFSESRISFWGAYGWSYWLIMWCHLLMPQLFWFKKIRKSIVFTFILMLFTNAGPWFESLVIYITSSYRDYFPSSWSVYQNSYFLYWLESIVCFSVASSSLYWFLHKRKKLPFPSAILSYSLFFIPYFLLLCSQNFS